MSDKADPMPSPSNEGDAPTVPEELLPKRGPGRPLGAKNKDRVSSIERINREGDPLGFRLKALKRGYVMAAPTEGAKVREKIYLTADEMLRLAGALEDKILPRLRSIEVTGDVGTHNNVLIGTLNGLSENQLGSLIGALQPQYPHAIEHTEVAPDARPLCNFDRPVGEPRPMDARARIAAAELIEAELYRLLDETDRAAVVRALDDLALQGGGVPEIGY